MTEAEWLACTNSAAMTLLLGATRSGRKYRLLMCGWFRANFHLLPDERSIRAVEMAERLADGVASEEECREAGEAARQAAMLWKAKEEEPSALYAMLARSCLDVMDADYFGRQERAMRQFGQFVESDPLSCSLLRDIFGNPFRSVTIDPAWRTSTVLGLASAIYADRAFDRLPILADALEDVGCDQPDLLAHCRCDGPHVRGCWAVDLIHGKS